MEEVRKAIDGIGRQARGEELQHVAELQEGLKKLEEEMRPRSIDEQGVMRDFEEECEEKVTREDRGEICGKCKGKGNGGKGEHACRGEGFRGKGAAGMMKGDDEVGEDEEKKGSRRPRSADWDRVEEVRQGTSEGKWHKARTEQGSIWLDGSDEEQEKQEGSAKEKGERCEVRKEESKWTSGDVE